MSRDFRDEVLRHVLNQVQIDAQELDLLPYADWHERVERSVRSFVPDLIGFAPDLMEEVQLILNSPRVIRESWDRLNSKLKERGLAEEMKRDLALIESELARESHLLAQITGETVSGLISDFWCRVRPDIVKNNRSTYPDLYFDWAQYSMLPRRSKSNTKGPALKGANPTSVPDGVEVKSQRGESIRVDCHHPHQGMHLVMTVDYINETWEVYDVYIAYLSRTEYKRAARNTTATTEKFSFSHAPFVSVLDKSAL